MLEHAERSEANSQTTTFNWEAWAVRTELSVLVTSPRAAKEFSVLAAAVYKARITFHTIVGPLEIVVPLTEHQAHCLTADFQDAMHSNTNYLGDRVKAICLMAAQQRETQDGN